MDCYSNDIVEVTDTDGYRYGAYLRQRIDGCYYVWSGEIGVFKNRIIDRYQKKLSKKDDKIKELAAGKQRLCSQVLKVHEDIGWLEYNNDMLELAAENQQLRANIESLEVSKGISDNIKRVLHCDISDLHDKVRVLEEQISDSSGRVEEIKHKLELSEAHNYLLWGLN